MPKRDLNNLELFNISILWFALAFHWGAILGILLQKQVLAFVPSGNKGLYYSILAGSGAAVAGIVQIVVGSWSDRMKSRWGRRIPFIAWGVLLNTIAILSLGWANSFTTLIIAFIGVQVFANIAQGPLHAIIPDMVNKSQQGKASAIMGVLTFLGQAMGPLFAGILISRPNGVQDLTIFIAVLTNLFMIYTLIFVRESSPQKSVNNNKELTFLEMFSFPLDEHPNLKWTVFSRLLINMGFYTALGFLMYYVKESLNVKEYETATGILMMTITIAGILSAYPGGVLADKYSKKTILYLTGSMVALMPLLFVFLSDYNAALVCGFVLGLGFGAFSTTNWALACNFIPSESAAKFMSLWNLSFVIPQIIAPIIAGYPSDWINLHFGAGNGYRAILLLVAIYILAGIIALVPIREDKLA